MKVLFAGSPKSSAVILSSIVKEGFDVVGVISQPDKRSNRMLEAPNIASINIHFSLLPKYRGASPIQASILNNDNETGISTMKMTKGMDEGPVYCFHKTDILESDNKINLE